MKSAKDTPPVRTIALPTLPRCDEANRTKWLQEYDRVESELLRPHIAGTATLGLRQLPSSWDRTIPQNVVDDDRIVKRAKSTGPIIKIERTPRPLSARPSVASAPLAATPAPAFNDTRKIWRLLLTLINPPVAFRGQVAFDISGIDLNWLLRYLPGDRTPTLNTLETLRDDSHGSKSSYNAINSPRSVIVMLRNGVTTDDLQVWPIEKFLSPGLAEDVAAARCQHRDDRRLSLLASLREEYRLLSSQLSLFDLLDDMHLVDDTPTFQKRIRSSDSQAAQQRREEHARAIALQAERRQQQIDAKMKRADEILQQKSEDFRAKIAKRQQMKSERQQRSVSPEVTSKSAPQGAARESPRFLRASSPPDLAKHRRSELRLAKNREMIEQQQKLLEEKQIAREQAIAERFATVEAERRARHEEKAEARRHAELNRAAAKEKARQIEEKVRLDAERKASKASERLAAFGSYKAAQASQNAAAEAEKRHLQVEAARKAEEKRIAEAERLRERHERETQRLLELQRQKELSLKHLQLVHITEHDDKSFFVERQKKAQNFEKLLFIADLEEKKQRADAMLRSRSPM